MPEKKNKNLKSLFLNKSILQSDLTGIILIAALNLILHLITIARFGIFRDELYYLDCSDHLDFGYVDQPPLSILILRIVRFIGGDSLAAMRLIPILCGVMFIILTGLLARELGGKKSASTLAAAAAFAVSGNFFSFHIFSMNSLDFIFWLAGFFLVVRIIKTQNPRLWIVFGIVAGVGLQNKISVLFLLFGLCVGLILTKERKNLRSAYFWIGGILSGLLFLPYVIWNITHEWPLLEFIHNAKAFKMADVTPFSYLLGQILHNNPITLIIWLIGLLSLFFLKNNNYRLFGWMYLSIYILFTLQGAKDYYMMPAYPILFAAGAVQWETWLNTRKKGRIKSALILSLLSFGIVFCWIGLPILSIENTARMSQAMGLTEHSGEKHEMGELPQHYADMFGWEEMAGKVSEVFQSLSTKEKKDCFIFAQNYGEAGAVNQLGKKLGLPPAFSGHNNHYFWPPTDYSGNVIIIIGGNIKDYKAIFQEVILSGRTDCRYCMPYENNLPIFICRGLRLPMKEIWARTKHYN